MSREYNKNGCREGQKPRAEAAVALSVMAVFLASDLWAGPLLSAALTAGAGTAGTALLLVVTGKLRPAPLAEGFLFAGATLAAHLLSLGGIHGMALPLGQAAAAALLAVGGGSVPGMPALPGHHVRIVSVAMLAAAAVEATLAVWLDPAPVVLWGVLAISIAAAALAVRRSAARPAVSPFGISGSGEGRFSVSSGGSEICAFEMRGTGSLASVTRLVVSSGASPWLALDALGEAAAGEGYSALLLEGDPLEETILLSAGYSRREGGWHRVIPVTGRKAVRSRRGPG